MSRIGLIDIDGHNFPNLALMKISAYHKAIGDAVEWVELGNHDRTYMSKVFSFSDDYQPTFANLGEVIKGGTGYDLKNKLSKEIEAQFPDYSIYPQYDYAVGFLTRGCPRACDFCIVSEKEGKTSHKVNNLKDFWNGQKKIRLLDPNILACKDKIELFQQLIASNVKIDFSQGLDIRLMTDEVAKLIMKLKLEMIHFAWDNYEFKTYEKLKEFRSQLNYNERKLRVYVLVNFNTKFEQDLERVYKLKELKYHPYVMIYNKSKAPKKIKQLARWCNNPYIWFSGTCETFEDYLTFN